MTTKKTVWVAYTNTDCTEGRGRDVPIAYCESLATAKRLAKKRYVQGSDGPVRSIELVEIEGELYIPSSCINIVAPTEEDIAEQTAIEAKYVAIAKAKAAGLTQSDLNALGIKEL